VAEANTSTESGSELLPAAKERAFITSDMTSRKDTNVHHQCSTIARRKRKVHRFEDSVIDARAVTSPWRKAVRTAKAIEPQENPPLALLLT